MQESERAVFELATDRGAPGVTWIRARVDLDMATVPSGRRELAAMCTDGVRWLLVDIGASCFVDARGLQMLLDTSRTLRDRGGELLVVSDSRALRRVLQILNLDGDLVLRRSAREALEEVGCGGHRCAGPGSEPA